MTPYTGRILKPHASTTHTFLRTSNNLVYLVVDESRHGFDLKHVGFMSSEFMNKNISSPVISVRQKTECVRVL